MTFRRALGVLLLGAGLVLVLFFRDARFEWFEGGWLGVAFIAVGVWDLVDDARRGRGRRRGSRSIVDELRDDIRRDFGSSPREHRDAKD